MLAIASFVVCPVIPAIVALVLASSAKRSIVNSGGTLGGQGLVTAARIVAWCNIGVATLVVGLIVLVAIFGSSSSSVTTDNVTVVGRLFL